MKKLDGGGWRFVGRRQAREQGAMKDPPSNRYHRRINGKAFVHTVIKDHSRVAYAEVHDDERTQTAGAVLNARPPGSLPPGLGRTRPER